MSFLVENEGLELVMEPKNFRFQPFVFSGNSPERICIRKIGGVYQFLFNGFVDEHQGPNSMQRYFDT